MGNRYSRLFSCEKNSPCGDYPVQLAAGVLLQDNQDNKKLVQLKFNSLSADSICSLTVQLHLFDEAGNALPDTVTKTYAGLKVKYGKDFGQDTAISVPVQAAAFQVEMVALECVKVNKWLFPVPLLLVAAAFLLILTFSFTAQKGMMGPDPWLYITAAILPAVLAYGFKKPEALQNSATVWMIASGIFLCMFVLSNVLYVAGYQSLTGSRSTLTATLQKFIAGTPGAQLLNYIVHWHGSMLSNLAFWNNVCLAASNVMSFVLFFNLPKKKK